MLEFLTGLARHGRPWRRWLWLPGLLGMGAFMAGLAFSEHREVGLAGFVAMIWAIFLNAAIQTLSARDWTAPPQPGVRFAQLRSRVRRAVAWILVTLVAALGLALLILSSRAIYAT